MHNNFLVVGEVPTVPVVQIPEVLESLALKSADLLNLRSNIDDSVIPLDDALVPIFSSMALDSKYSLEHLQYGDLQVFSIKKKSFFKDNFHIYIRKQDEYLEKQIKALENNLALISLQKQLLFLLSD